MDKQTARVLVVPQFPAFLEQGPVSGHCYRWDTDGLPVAFL